MLDHFDRPLTFQIHCLQNRSAARDLALALLAEGRQYCGVEIFDGPKRFRVERPLG